MTITLDLSPDVENSLLAQAQAKGVSITDYVEEIVQRQARQSLPEISQPSSQVQNLYELFAPVRGLLTDEEVDTLFARTRSFSRPVDFE
jgi:hypothetical protein